eukprot:scpid74750/ scgid32563/ 
MSELLDSSDDNSSSDETACSLEVKPVVVDLKVFWEWCQGELANSSFRRHCPQHAEIICKLQQLPASEKTVVDLLKAVSRELQSCLARPTMNASRMGLGVLRACPTVIRPLWFAAVGKAVEISHVSYDDGIQLGLFARFVDFCWHWVRAASACSQNVASPPPVGVTKSPRR